MKVVLDKDELWPVIDAYPVTDERYEMLQKIGGKVIEIDEALYKRYQAARSEFRTVNSMLYDLMPDD